MPDKERAPWDCRKCSGADGTAFRNPGNRLQCRICKGSKSACYKRNVPDPRGPSARPSTTAQQSASGGEWATKARAAGYATPAAFLALQKKCQAAEAKCKELQKPSTGPIEVDEEVESDHTLEELVQQLHTLQGLPDVQGLLALAIAAKQEEIERKRTARDAGKKPINLCRDIERKLERKQRALEQAREKQETARQAVATATAEPEQADLDAACLESEVCQLKLDLTTAAAKLASEQQQAQQQWHMPAEAANTAQRSEYNPPAQAQAAELPPNLAETITSMVLENIKQWQAQRNADTERTTEQHVEAEDPAPPKKTHRLTYKADVRHLSLPPDQRRQTATTAAASSASGLQLQQSRPSRTTSVHRARSRSNNKRQLTVEEATQRHPKPDDDV